MKHLERVVQTSHGLSIHFIDPPPCKLILYTGKEAKAAANGLTDDKYNFVYTMEAAKPVGTKAASKQVTPVESLKEVTPELPTEEEEQEPVYGENFMEEEAVNLGLETRGERRKLENHLAKRAELSPQPVSSLLHTFLTRVVTTGMRRVVHTGRTGCPARLRVVATGGWCTMHRKYRLYKIHF